MSIFTQKKVLIVSAHADDESFGMGGTIYHLKEEECEVYWLIMSKVWSPRWDIAQIKQREADIIKVSRLYSFERVIRWDYPDNKMETILLDEYQAKMISVLEELKPNFVFSPSPWDWNTEHKLAFEVLEMSVKPLFTPYLEGIFAYEIPSSTDWGYKSYRQFPYNFYVDINPFIEKKIRTCELYSTEVGIYPHPRSPEGIQAFAQSRGMEVGLKAAEGFQLMRYIAKK
jgi:LmbE family N-acetylglucosaminyl deacetylase